MVLAKLTREELLLAGGALLLAIALLEFPWFSFATPFGTFHLTGTDSPNGTIGAVGLLACVLLLADVLIRGLTAAVSVPTIKGDRDLTRFAEAGLAAGCVALKFVLNIHFSEFGWGFYLCVVLAGALLYLTNQARDAEKPWIF